MLPGATEIPFGDVEALKTEIRRGDVAAFIMNQFRVRASMSSTEKYGEHSKRPVTRRCPLYLRRVQTGIGEPASSTPSNTSIKLTSSRL